MNYISIFDKDIIAGRIYKNKNEIILYQKYRPLLNKFICFKIGENIYRFRVVGIYKSNYLVNDDFFYTNVTTLKSIYNNFHIHNNYYYHFIIDDLKKLNDNLDILNLDGYDVAIVNDKNYRKASNYQTIVDFILMIDFILASIIFIIIFHNCHE